MSLAQPLFEFSEVTVRFDGVTALDRLDLEVPATGITVVMGRSGAGKTTLLRLCNRLEVPSQGTVNFKGADLATLDPLGLRRRVGMVFQRPALFPGTVAANLAVADPGSDGPGLLNTVGLDPGLLNREADRLSGGEAQRACLARTLATRPEVLLMDEPTASLDAAAVAMLESLAKRLAGAGMPILWVTHDVAQAERLADRVIELTSGRATGP